jgi:hypothetical protein
MAKWLEKAWGEMTSGGHRRFRVSIFANLPQGCLLAGSANNADPTTTMAYCKSKQAVPLVPLVFNSKPATMLYVLHVQLCHIDVALRNESEANNIEHQNTHTHTHTRSHTTVVRAYVRTHVSTYVRTYLWFCHVARERWSDQVEHGQRAHADGGTDNGVYHGMP